MRRKVSIYTFGCKLNQYESQGMAEELAENYDLSFGSSTADIFIVNSCTVTGEAERKLRQLYRRLKKMNPSSLFVVAGCYSEVSPDELEKLGFDLILGVKDRLRIKEKIGELLSESEVSRSREFFVVSSSPDGRTRAYVGIEDGCLNHCSYCKIRLARGHEIVSKPVGVVLDEVAVLLKRGFKEIVLTGINIEFYGRDTGENLVQLLRELSAINGDFRVRLSSIDPGTVDERLLDIVVNSERFAQHFHLSLQSGSDRILRLMKRGYTVRDYLSITEKIRAMNPRFSFTTDVIVGFPGETTDDFRETVSFVRLVEFLKVHIFRFSPRKGTLAATMDCQIDNTLKKIRAGQLRDVALVGSDQYLKKQLGAVSRVLVERIHGGLSYGYDEYYIPHVIECSSLQNEFVDVCVREIKRTEAWSDAELCCGSVVE